MLLFVTTEEVESKLVKTRDELQRQQRRRRKLHELQQRQRRRRKLHELQQQQRRRRKRQNIFVPHFIKGFDLPTSVTRFG